MLSVLVQLCVQSSCLLKWSGCMLAVPTAAHSTFSKRQTLILSNELLERESLFSTLQRFHGVVDFAEGICIVHR